MINKILLGIKIFGLVSALGVGVYAFNAAKNWYANSITEAVNNAKIEATLERNEAIRTMALDYSKTLSEERERLRKEVEAERQKATDLRRMLLIDHDLDRLLQRKPGLILPKVNDGTQELFDEVEELTK